MLELKQHFATEETAIASARPHIRAWEIDAGLRRGVAEFTFDFEKAEIIDRNPDPGRAQVFAVAARATTRVFAAVAAIHAKYPDPPDPSFEATPDVETLWARYEGNPPLQPRARTGWRSWRANPDCTLQVSYSPLSHGSWNAM